MIGYSLRISCEICPGMIEPVDWGRENVGQGSWVYLLYVLWYMIGVHLTWHTIFVRFLTYAVLAMCYVHELFLGLAPLEVGWWLLKPIGLPLLSLYKQNSYSRLLKGKCYYQMYNVLQKSHHICLPSLSNVQDFQFGMLNFPRLLDLLPSSL